MFEHLNVTWPIVAGDDENLVVKFVEPTAPPLISPGAFACDTAHVVVGANAADYTAAVTVGSGATPTRSPSLTNAMTRHVRRRAAVLLRPATDVRHEENHGRRRTYRASVATRRADRWLSPACRRPDRR
jgi:hypothetical protein